jgi:hypothetical protein
MRGDYASYDTGTALREPKETKYLNLCNKTNFMHYVHLDTLMYRDARSTKL